MMMMQDLISLKLTLCSPALFRKNGATFFTAVTGNPSLRIKGDESAQIEVNSLSVHVEVHSWLRLTAHQNTWACGVTFPQIKQALPILQTLFRQSLDCTTSVKAECINTHRYLRVNILDIQIIKSKLFLANQNTFYYL